MAPAEQVSVEVVFSPKAGLVERSALSLPAGSTVRDAVAASGLVDVEPLSVAVGVWGRKVTLGDLLRDGDRVELYRPLTVDPKEARRQRYRAQGEKLPKGIHRSPRGG